MTETFHRNYRANGKRSRFILKFKSDFNPIQRRIPYFVSLLTSQNNVECSGSVFLKMVHDGHFESLHHREPTQSVPRWLLFDKSTGFTVCFSCYNDILLSMHKNRCYSPHSNSFKIAKKNRF